MEAKDYPSKQKCRNQNIYIHNLYAGIGQYRAVVGQVTRKGQDSEIDDCRYLNLG